MDLQFDFRCLQYFSYLHSGLKRLHSWNTVSERKKKHLAFNSWTYCYFRQHTVVSSASYQQISWSKWESTSDGWFCWYPSERVVDNQLTVAASSPSDSHTFSLDSLSWYSCHFSCHLCLVCSVRGSWWSSDYLPHFWGIFSFSFLAIGGQKRKTGCVFSPTQAFLC